ncbi:MAG TPA: formylglycine-generating enzyme family protein [Bdellovibrionales bacterium]|nr:formylglycine-generating enzyme family protein [Bdellovibrionales bacterium]
MWLGYLLIFIFPVSFALGAVVTVPKAKYSPLFRDPGEEDSNVGPLKVDVTPVTNRQFLDFLKSNPRFLRSRLAPLYADRGYLSHWTGDTSFAPGHGDFPVTNVSWFMARKYCEYQGQRLPTIAEWEVASDAQNPAVEKSILEWYAHPNSALRAVQSEPPNRYGIKGAHMLIWEWVENYSEAILSGDSRGGSSTESRYCGGAALKAKDPTRYAAFMRFAFRGSLTAKYTSKNLGFRCVQDIGRSK